MRIIKGLVPGPFGNEQSFKRAVLQTCSTYEPKTTLFEIENEEKEPGMPDVLAVHPSLPATFIEFKYANKNGVIEFQYSQPRFYRQHDDLNIQILAWDGRMGGRVIFIEPSEVVAAKSLRIALPEDIPDVLEYAVSPEESCDG
jgi:hypothetical protein